MTGFITKDALQKKVLCVIEEKGKQINCREKV